MNLTRAQRMTVLAAFLGWMLDAFDFFLLVFLLSDIAQEFGVQVSDVAYAVFLTLAMRFIGAFIFVLMRTFALDLLREIGLDGNRFRLLIGLGFLLIVFWSPDGVIGLWERWRNRHSPAQQPQRGAHG